MNLREIFCSISRTVLGYELVSEGCLYEVWYYRPETGGIEAGRGLVIIASLYVELPALGWIING